MCARAWGQGNDTGTVPVSMKLTSFLREADNVNTHIHVGGGGRDGETEADRTLGPGYYLGRGIKEELGSRTLCSEA